MGAADRFDEPVVAHGEAHDEAAGVARAVEGVLAGGGGSAEGGALAGAAGGVDLGSVRVVVEDGDVGVVDGLPGAAEEREAEAFGAVLLSEGAYAADVAGAVVLADDLGGELGLPGEVARGPFVDGRVERRYRRRTLRGRRRR